MRITDIKGVAPTNYKKGMLYLNKYRFLDVMIMAGAFLWGFAWLILLLFVFVPNIYSFIFLVIILPCLAIAMVQPMNNYHNNLEYVILLFNYNFRRCRYFSSLVKQVVPAGKNRYSKKKKKGE